jgi:hypothetical protein
MCGAPVTPCEARYEAFLVAMYVVQKQSLEAELRIGSKPFDMLVEAR